MRFSYVDSYGERHLVDNAEFAYVDQVILPEEDYKVTPVIGVVDSDDELYVIYGESDVGQLNELIDRWCKEGYMIFDKRFNVIWQEADHYEYVSYHKDDKAELSEAVAAAHELEEEWNNRADSDK